MVSPCWNMCDAYCIYLDDLNAMRTYNFLPFPKQHQIDVVESILGNLAEFTYFLVRHNRIRLLDNTIPDPAIVPLLRNALLPATGNRTPSANQSLTNLLK